MAPTRLPHDDHSKRILKALLEADGEVTLEDLAETTGLGRGPVAYRLAVMAGEKDTPTIDPPEEPLVEKGKEERVNGYPILRDTTAVLTEPGEERAEDVADDVDVEVPDDYVRPQVKIGLAAP